VKDTPYLNVCNSYLSRGVLDYERFLVLNVFFVRELTKRLPANSPVIVTAVNPGFCKSELGRNQSLVYRMLGKIMQLYLPAQPRKDHDNSCGLPLVVSGVSSSCAAAM
jgi:hypothetical protein